MQVLIVGCGYLGGRAARLWRESGCEVSALTRSAQRAEQLRGLGVTPLVGDVMDRASLAALPSADVLLYAVGHDRSDSTSKRDVTVGGLANVLKEVRRRVGRIVYVSSVSVYGQSDGSWVDEASPCQPASEGGRICLDAEAVFRREILESDSAAVGNILRLAGIYGPGRLIARTDQLRNGRPVSGNPDAWLNLIHVEDAARCVVACGSLEAAGGTYLVSDDRPVTRMEFYSMMAELVGAPPPVFDSQAGESERTTGLNKRCRNARMRADLLSELIYPDVATGLPASIDAHE